MQILPPSFNVRAKNIQDKNSHSTNYTSYLKTTNNVDTFAKTPSFKGIEKELLRTPDKLVEALTKGISNANITKDPLKIGEMIGGALFAIYNLFENEDNKSNEDSVKNLTGSFTKHRDNVEVTNEEITLENNEQQTEVRIQFPPKRGRLNKSEQDIRDFLKNKEESISIETNNKIINLYKKAITINEDELENFNKKNFIESFAKDLISTTSNEEIIEIITNYENQLTNFSANSDIATLEEESIRVEEQTNYINAQGLYRTESETAEMRKPKIVGKLNLTESTKTRKLESTVLDEEINKYSLNVPGTLNTLNQNLYTLLYSFTTNIDEKRPKVMDRDSVEYATAKNIETHINKNKGFEKLKKMADYELLAEILSSGKFKRFSLHSALRFIERFINFNNEYISIEEQCDNAIKAIENAIQESFEEKKVIYDIYHYQYENLRIGKISTIYAPRMIINPKDLNLSKEDSDILGDLPIEITFAHDKKDKNKAVIVTLYSRGIDTRIE